MRDPGPNAPMYNVSGVAEILNSIVNNQLTSQRVSYWFNELHKRGYEGLSESNSSNGRELFISFQGLVELVAIATMDQAGVSISNILNARVSLKKIDRALYPFANVPLLESLRREGKKVRLDYHSQVIELDGTNQYNLEFIRSFLISIDFDIVNGVIQRMMPKKGKGIIVIDPRISQGLPCIVGKDITLDEIQKQFKGPQSYEVLKANYDLEKEEVDTGLAYLLK